MVLPMVLPMVADGTTGQRSGALQLWGIGALLATLALSAACGGIAIVDDPGSGGGDGRPGCDEIARLYREQLSSARACNPAFTFPQCTSERPDQLSCPCATFVNPANDTAVLAAAGLAKSWRDGGCVDDAPCTPIACIELAGGACGSDGSCNDVASQ
jgi:hypothetical protein